jgi:hypothetical protein
MSADVEKIAALYVRVRKFGVTGTLSVPIDLSLPHNKKLRKAVEEAEGLRVVSSKKEDREATSPADGELSEEEPSISPV